MTLDTSGWVDHFPSVPDWTPSLIDQVRRRKRRFARQRWDDRGWGDDTKPFKYTYFMYCPDCGLVKVGGSKNPERRRGAVQREHRKKCRGLFADPATSKIALLATVLDNQQVRFRRWVFPDLYVRREWLRYVPRVRHYLAVLRHENA
jgi:hypothetical protein